MFNLLRVLSYSNVSKKGLNQLPRESGIYYFIDCFKVLYVGQGKSVYHRWQSNHKHKPRFLKSWFARLHYRSVKEANLDLIEALEIKRFDPPLNIQKPDPEKYKNRIDRIMEEVYWIAGIAVLGVALIAICLSRVL